MASTPPALPDARRHANGQKRDWSTAALERADYVEVVWDGQQRRMKAGHAINVAEHEGHDQAFRESSVDLQEWITETRTFHPETGGLRLLVLDRHRYDPELPLTEDTYNLLAEKFKLSDRTRNSFNCDAGIFSRSYCFDESDNVTGINILIKAPQKREVGNFGLSVHYEVSTAVTTALLFATNVVICRSEPNAVPKETDVILGHENLTLPDNLSKKEQEKWHFSNILNFSQGHAQRANPRLLSSIEKRKAKLNHPLALPYILLEEHLNGSQEMCESGLVADKTWEIMNSLGIRSDDYDEQEIFWSKAMSLRRAYTKEGSKDRFNAARLTAKIDRQVLRILYSQKSPEFNRDCSKWLLELSEEINVRVPVLQNDPQSMSQSTSQRTSQDTPQSSGTSSPSSREPRFKGPLHEELRENLEYNVQMSQSLLSRLTTMKENMMLQLDVCSNITGQSSNSFNAKIAWDTSRDSTSMKILAVITAAFLPGTFVATFMSMGFWNWRWSPIDPQNGQPGVVSTRWWIYIAAALPLTALTLIGWAVWWVLAIVQREKSYMSDDSGQLGDSFLERLVREYLMKREEKKKKKESEKESAEGSGPTLLVSQLLRSAGEKLRHRQEGPLPNGDV